MDPIVLGHAVYRPLLMAMSRPGTVHALPAEARAAPLLALADALLDREVTFHLAAAHDGLRRELCWRTGARPAPLAEADFLLFPDGRSGGRLGEARRGTLDYPDRGATAVYRVRRCEPSGGAALLRGPGIRDSASPRLVGLAEEELAGLRDANVEFPLGIDAIFLDEEGRVLCLPRSTRIEVR